MLLPWMEGTSKFSSISQSIDRPPVRLGLVGLGQMGADLFVQISFMSNIQLMGIAVRNCAKAQQEIERLDPILASSVHCAEGSAIDCLMEKGITILTEDIASLCSSDFIDVVIDATGNPNKGCEIALQAIAHGKHIVMLNVETDITIGRYLAAQAQRAKVVYTGAAGDEPAALYELISFAQKIGFEIVCAGKGKNNPLDFGAMPSQYEKEALKRGMSSRILTEFVDGSKTMIEMVAIANATGLLFDVPGMHGPKVSKDQLANVFCPSSLGGLLTNSGVIDYTIDPTVAPGVFCVVKANHPRLEERMIDLGLGPKGPFFALVRPFHLTSLETPLSAIRACLYHHADIKPLPYPVAECVAIAKRPLMVGETMGAIGGTDYRGFAMDWGSAREASAVPLGLVESAKIIQPIALGEKLTYINVVPNPDLLITQLRSKQDQSDSSFSL